MQGTDINLVAPINQLGYGVVGANILKALNKAGKNVALWPVGGRVEWPGDSYFQGVVKKGMFNAQFYNEVAPSLRIWHQFELDMFPGRGRRVAWPIFELDKFNDRELHHLKRVDHIVVCSEWAKSVIEANGIDVPVTVVPLGVDPELFYCNEAERASRAYWLKDATVFINVGKWEKRKGHEELLAAFNAAFSPRDNVELWMINDNPFIGHENDIWKKKYANSAMGPNIKFFPRFEGHHQMRKVFAHVDCGVFPSHAEGWNLEIPELMACGAHIIATDYSAHTQFLADENSFKIDSTGLEEAHDGKWFNGQGNWTTFDIDQLVERLREVHERKQSGELGLNTAGIETAKGLTWERSVECLEEALSPLALEVA
jgi:glycosyltransferase involved in cell wall biosynthesis